MIRLRVDRIDNEDVIIRPVEILITMKEFFAWFFSKSETESIHIAVCSHRDQYEALRRQGFWASDKKNKLELEKASKNSKETLRHTVSMDLDRIEKNFRKLISDSYKDTKKWRIVLLLQLIIATVSLLPGFSLFTRAIVIILFLCTFLSNVAFYARLIKYVTQFYFWHGQLESMLKLSDYRGYQTREYDLEHPLF